MHVELLLIAIIRQDIPDQLLRFEFLDRHECFGGLNIQKLVHNASELPPLRRIRHQQEPILGRQSAPIAAFVSTKEALTCQADRIPPERTSDRTGLGMREEVRCDCLSNMSFTASGLFT